MKRNVILVGDVRERLRDLPDESVHVCVTSPPYWGLRDYGTASWEGGDEGCDHVHKDAVIAARKSTLGPKRDGLGPDNQAHAADTPYRDICGKCGARRIDAQLGLEATPELYVQAMVEVFREVRRVLRRDGTLWLNLGDSYASQGGPLTFDFNSIMGGKSEVQDYQVTRKPPPRPQAQRPRRHTLARGVRATAGRVVAA